MKPQKRLPFRRKPISQNDQIMRDRNKFEKQNLSIAEYIVADPSKVDWCWGILEWAAIIINPPLETE